MLEEFKVNSRHLSGAGDDLVHLSNTLKTAGAEVSQIRSGLRGKIVRSDDIGNRLKQISGALDTLNANMNRYGNAAHTISGRYQTAEKKIAGTAAETGSIAGISAILGGTDNSTDESNKNAGTSGGETSADEEKKKEVSWKEIKGEKDGKIFGFDSHGEAKGALGHAEYDNKFSTGIKWKISKDENGNSIKKLDDITLISAAVTGSAALVVGSAKGNCGLLSGEIKGEIGKVSGQGEVKASLMEDGKFKSKISAGVEASATGAEASGKVAFGTENTDVHVSADGKLGYAKASAGVQAGKISYENSDGETVEAWGAGAEAGAEAYLAQGTVKGGFSIMGVKFDVGLTGKAGGVGAKAGGSVTTGGVHGSVGLGAGLGLGLDVGIDWSGFKWGW